MLPGQSGLDLVTLLRHDPTLARIPILVLTARAGSDAAVEAMAAGANDYVRSPRGPRTAGQDPRPPHTQSDP